MSDTPSSVLLPPVLRAVQSVMHGRWRALGEELYREVARTVEVSGGGELLVAGCGDGVSAEWLAERTGATVTGVDEDRERMRRAERRARTAGVHPAVSFESAPLGDLPHETGVFDAAIGEPLLASSVDPARAIAELVRVTKPMGVVVLLQLTWSTEIAPATRSLLAERLGVRPHHLMEWKQMLRDAGVVDIDVQDWSDGPLGRSPRALAPAGAAGIAGPRRSLPTPAFGVPRLSLPQKVHIVSRAWRRWGIRAGAVNEALGALEREEHVLRELWRERAVGFQLMRGVKWPHAREASR